jgi:hypothetical protein
MTSRVLSTMRSRLPFKIVEEKIALLCNSHRSIDDSHARKFRRHARFLGRCLFSTYQYLC